MKDGEVLLNYIDNQRESKTAIASALGMSRRNLYGLFESQTLTPETKKKFEEYFKTRIFTNVYTQNEDATNNQPATISEPNSEPSNESMQVIMKLAESN